MGGVKIRWKSWKKVAIIDGMCWHLRKWGVVLRSVFDLVVELCSFYDVCLKVVFKKVVFYDAKLTRIQLIAFELNSLRQVRMRIYTSGTRAQGHLEASGRIWQRLGHLGASGGICEHLAASRSMWLHLVASAFKIMVLQWFWWNCRQIGNKNY